jgi:hypothetical protein
MQGVRGPAVALDLLEDRPEPLLAAVVTDEHRVATAREALGEFAPEPAAPAGDDDDPSASVRQLDASFRRHGDAIGHREAIVYFIL